MFIFFPFLKHFFISIIMIYVYIMSLRQLLLRNVISVREMRLLQFVNLNTL